MSNSSLFDAALAFNQLPAKSPLFISLSRGKFTQINFEDYLLVAPYSWSATPAQHGKWYATAQTRITKRRNLRGMGHQPRKALLMHRLIMGSPSGKKIDHRDNDGLDNRRSNLRVCTTTQNHANRHVNWSSCGYKGVVLYGGRFLARCGPAKAREYLGSFNSAEQAARAYDAAAVRIFGDFAHLNFPDDKGKVFVLPLAITGKRKRSIYTDCGEHWSTTEEAIASLGISKSQIRHAINIGKRIGGRLLSRTPFKEEVASGLAKAGLLA